MSSAAPWTSTIPQKPQTPGPSLFSHLPLPHSRTIQFHRLNHNLTLKPLNSSSQPLYGSVSPAPPQDEDDDEEPAIGDCLVYEEGIFNDPFIENTRNSRRSGAHITKSATNKDADVSPENLIPDEWQDVQKELNITKKERRKMAQELEYGTRVAKRRQALMPLNSEGFEKTRQDKIEQMRLEKFEKIKQEKIKQLSPVVLDNPKKAYFREIKPEKETNGEVSGGRVAPRNPRLAVYGVGLEDVSAFFSSGKYESAAADKSQGTGKLFSQEEKAMMNRRVPDVAVATSGKWHPLHTLVATGEFYLVDSLLKHNLDINTPDKNGLTAIHKAILAKKQAIFNFLLRESANPFVRDNEGATLLHYAVFAASSQMIKILLLYNVDINLQDNDGWTPLHLAVQSRRTDILRLLLIKGADKSLKNKDGFTALDLCLYSGRDTRTYELIKLLKRIY
ncbi:ankyrin repeat domain-containing protein, chloroplastic-like [Salvia miltiorrhiza]|uniref:ankyrin repeat domain-containing protein, chloroplastic-like n=1 Tax=Salvia miltiorrhiza TaxID=226208 RepID=UPI0025AD090C|nr:ankyrin repeat domain-containing protein, chloroplastic-like [Salvia miltiorrhiza]